MFVLQQILGREAQSQRGFNLVRRIIMEKKDIFKEIYLGNYQRFIDSFMNKIETVVGFTDRQKINT